MFWQSEVRKLRRILINPAEKYGYGAWIWSGTKEKQKLQKCDFMNPQLDIFCKTKTRNSNIREKLQVILQLERFKTREERSKDHVDGMDEDRRPMIASGYRT